MPIKQVILGGQILHGEDRNGVWVVEKLTGWYESPASKGDGGERPLADGDYPYPMNYGPRMVTVDGILFHKGRGPAINAMEALAASARLTDHRIAVTDYGMTRYAVVKALGVEYTPVTREAIRFQIRLKAVDPFKYGEEHTETGAPVSLMHRGTVPAWPVVTVTGTSGGGYTLTLNGRSVVVTRALVSGSPHTIDFRSGILRVGGSVARSGFGTANFSPINPGLPQNMTTTAGTLSVRYSDAFI